MGSFTTLTELTQAIIPVDSDKISRAQAYQDTLIKPNGALGKLEEMAVRISAMQLSLKPSIKNAELFCFAADHGIAEEHVSAYPQEVSAQMIDGIAAGVAGVSCLAKSCSVKLNTYDVGLLYRAHHPAVISHPFMNGSNNFLKTQAMSKDMATSVVLYGANEVSRAVRERNIDICALGEVGIGNSTSAAALISAITNVPVHEVTGYGTGLDEEGIQHKREIIEEALCFHSPFNSQDGIELLCNFGGLEIAAMAGGALGAAALQTPFVIDGLISASALLLAYLIEPKVLEYCFVSHKSKEPGLMQALTFLNYKPYLDLDMRLGEGSGAVLAIALIRAACDAMSNMASFDEAKVSQREEANKTC